MSYVQSNLLPEEKVLYEAKVSPAIYALPMCIVATAIFTPEPIFLVLGGILFALWSALYQLTTEMAVTSKRVVMKTGLLSLRTLELNLSKIETFSVQQGVFGRLFGYGTVTVVGTGGTKESFKAISEPIEFRRNILQFTVSS